MMFGRGSASHALPQIGGIVQRSMKEDYSIIYSFVLDLLVPIIENQKTLRLMKLRLKIVQV